MGFLLGAYGAITYGVKSSRLHAQSLRVNIKLQRITREISKATKIIAQEKSAALAKISSKTMAEINNVSTALLEQFKTNHPNFFDADGNRRSDLTPQEMTDYNNLYAQEVTQKVTMMQNQLQARMAEDKSQVESYYEMMEETQLEPLRQMEEMLKVEKEQLENEITICKEQYEAARAMRKEGAQDLKIGGQ